MPTVELRDTELAGLRLTAQELVMCRNLVEAWPRPLRDGELVQRVQYHENGGPGDPVRRVSPWVCHVRSLLGDDAIETVFETRTNPRGHVVRVGKSIGYRAGPRLLELTGASEGGVPAAGGSAKGRTPPASLRRAWVSPGPHRNDQARITMAMEAACREAVGL